MPKRKKKLSAAEKKKEVKDLLETGKKMVAAKDGGDQNDNTEEIKKFDETGDKLKEAKAENTEQPKAPAAEPEKKVEAELAKPVVWITLSFSDGTCWKFPAAMVIRKAQAMGISIGNTEKEALIKFATEKMSWTEIRMKAIGIERDDAPDYNRDWKIAVKNVIYGV